MSGSPSRTQLAVPGVTAVVLDCQTVPVIDVTTGRMLEELGARLGDRGIRLVIAHDIGQVRDILTVTRLYDAPEVEQYPTVRDAVAAVTPASRTGHTTGGT